LIWIFYFIGQLELSLPTLTIPHPRLAERIFVIRPLAEIAPKKLIKNLLKKNTGHWVYVLAVRNQAYYTGYTTDVARRYRQHCQGSPLSKFTRSFGAQKLLQCWKMPNKSLALKAEACIKKQNRKTKTILVDQPALLNELFLKQTGIVLNAQPGNPELFEFAAKQC
jgi:putative endonuclease